MKNKFIASLLLLVSSIAMASPITMDLLSAPQGLTINNGAAVFTLPSNGVIEQILTQTGTQTVSNKSFDQSSNIEKQARAVYDFAITGGGTNVNINLAMGIPANSWIRQVWIDVITQPTSNGSATVGISAANGADILADTAVASLTTGLRQGKENYAAGTASLIKLSAATGVTLNLKTAALTAGKFAIWIQYMISDAP